ncbi:aminopeptidase N [Thiomicrospira sp. WB1]|uniref:aminopeptidase N n=1 Tax=Thiomicrospira sp. WB1 TaxID=1685380 RepID=UPI000749BBCD|nr:aminopeptidase N [Thiomicrospira sp. WB1]KUJ71590.1 aminopeptidase N [Thiomicrospira sp. WB1]
MTQPTEHFLTDYRPLSFSVSTVDLTFELAPNATRVTNVMRFDEVTLGEPIRLHGNGITLKALSVNGSPANDVSYHEDDEGILFTPEKTAFEMTVVTEISPQTNTELEGLYRSGGNYCTQCEAEGFRRITFFPDRPDLLTVYTTRIIAPKSDNRYLLANGNLVEQGELEDGQHYAVWHDPYPKPSYLFALVAGNLERVRDTFITQSGRTITLDLFVEPQNLNQCDHAMQSLKEAMAWDERRFGLEYDLDTYMIVAVDDFNMGAMENKGLNVFNSKFVLARPETATDTDYEGIESVIAHEYFHNWTGNRVTCRDWFQLTLKEGLTVFRDQLFTADMLSPAIKRIEDVKRLRSHQFVEDAGPMAHPIQPQSYIEMNNFYTLTVYEKGAEVVRLYHTLLGEAGFQKGMRLYFERFDGQAVTVEDFRQAMADANGMDLSAMHEWYVQPGTPRVQMSSHYDQASQQLRLSWTQRNDKSDSERPLPIPVGLKLWYENGEPAPMKPTGDALLETEKGPVFLLKDTQQTLTFEGLSARPVVSALRDFSAPVILETDHSDQERSQLARFDDDAFVRWESVQALALKTIIKAVRAVEAGDSVSLAPAFEQAILDVLDQADLDLGLKALALTLPDLDYVCEQFDPIPVDAVWQAYRGVELCLAQTFETAWRELYERLHDRGPYAYDARALAQRKLKQVCLHYLSCLPEGPKLAKRLFEQSIHMTDTLAALQAVNHDSLRTEPMQVFYQRWRHEPLVLDKWFALQAKSRQGDVIEQIRALLAHPDFHYQTPNRVRSVLGVFARQNFYGFHQKDGQGYQLLGEQIHKLDSINPQVAARLCAPLTQWRRLDSPRQGLMREVLEALLSESTLSADVYEIVSKSLKNER